MGAIQVERELRLHDGIGYWSHTSDLHRVLIIDKDLVDQHTGDLRRKIGVSISSGCRVGCIYCFTNGYSSYRPLTVEEMVQQVHEVLARRSLDPSRYSETRISFKQMGDLLPSAGQVARAIELLSAEHPELCYTLSTSAPRIEGRPLQQIRELAQRTQIRLQISCHTTSDKERFQLSPRIPMMSLREISELIRWWRDGDGGCVTLVMVMIRGLTYDAVKLSELISPADAVIKLSYLDHNRYTRIHRLADLPLKEVITVEKALRDNSYKVYHRRSINRGDR